MFYLLTKREPGAEVEYLAASPTIEFCERLQDEHADRLVEAGNLPPKVETRQPMAGKPVRCFLFANKTITAIYAVPEA